MATQVQLRRGTSTECDAFTGAVGEAFYDTTNSRLRMSDGSTAGGIPLAKLSEAGGSAIGQGVHMLPIVAAAMYPRATNGPGVSQFETSSNKNNYRTLDFDTTTQEFAQFVIPMPESWNEGTVTFAPIWSHPATTTDFGVVWALQAVAISNDDAGDVAFGTEQTSTDTGGTTDDIYIGPASSAITIAGSPAAGDFVLFQVKRNPSGGSDTMAVDARLHGIRLYYTISAETDT